MSRLSCCLFIVFVAITCFSSDFNLDLSRGWNLISVPIEDVMTEDFGSSIITPIYWYDVDSTRNYKSIADVSNDTLYPGTGYWVMSRSEQTITLTGDLDSCLDYPELSRGWNMGGAAELRSEYRI